MLGQIMFMNAPQKGDITISESTRESLKEAIALLKNAASYAARNDSPEVTREIADVLCRADGILKYDEVMSVVEEYSEQLKKRMSE